MIHLTKTIETLSQLQTSLDCLLCCKSIRDPHTIMKCGHHFCKTCIQSSLEKKGVCPTCELPCWKNDLKPNHLLKDLVDAANFMSIFIADPYEPKPNVPIIVDDTKRAKRRSCQKLYQKNAFTEATIKHRKDEYFLEKRVKTNDSSSNKPETVLVTPDTRINRRGRRKEPKQDSIRNHVFVTPSSTIASSKRKKRRVSEPALPTKMKRDIIKPRAPNSARRVKKTSTPGRNAKGETALHRAAIKGDMEAVMKHLSADNCVINAKDNAGWTPLHEACNHEHIDIVKKLLDAGADVNICGWDDVTPLHDTLNIGNLEIALVLLQHGANEKALNAALLTPLELAEPEIRLPIVQFLDQRKGGYETLLAKPTSSSSSSSSSTTSSACASSTRPSRFNNNNKNSGNVALPDPSTLASASLISALTLDDIGDGEYQIANVVLTGVDDTQKKHIEHWIKELHSIVQTKVDSAATHVIASVVEDRAKRTVKYLTGILLGKWIVSYEWIKESARIGKFVSEVNYEVKSDGNALNGPRKGRENTMDNKPKLFDGCYFYFSGNFTHMPLCDLRSLIEVGGGTILLREPKGVPSITQIPYHVGKRIQANNNDNLVYTHYIVSEKVDSTSNDKTTKNTLEPPLCRVTGTWVLNCVSYFSVLSPDFNFDK